MERIKNNRKRLSITTAIGLTGLLTGGLAWAQSPQFKGGEAWAGDPVEVSALYTGLGAAVKEGLFVQATLTGTFDITCTNKGGTRPVGLQKKFTEQTIMEIDADDVNRSGRYEANLMIDVPDEGLIPGAPDCPNPNYTEIREVTLTGVTVTLLNAGGVTLLSNSCTFGEADHCTLR